MAARSKPLMPPCDEDGANLEGLRRAVKAASDRRHGFDHWAMGRPAGNRRLQEQRQRLEAWRISTNVTAAAAAAPRGASRAALACEDASAAVPMAKLEVAEVLAGRRVAQFDRQRCQAAAVRSENSSWHTVDSSGHWASECSRFITSTEGAQKKVCAKNELVDAQFEAQLDRVRRWVDAA
mmetsp:Transcript_113537/g.321243  ORF Transcript_113537/g.321243 Transcript_113537/m.321243 type:complete len:180 (-) Transcript_113537:69-608(-)